MRKGEKTRQRVIETAAKVLNRHGYAGSGISELMDATGLAKGGIYRHFESKQELAVEAFRYAFAQVLTLRFEDLDSVPDAADKLVKYVEGYAAKESPIPGGCPVLNTGIENDDGNPALLKCAQDAFDTVVHRLAEIIRDGQKKNEIRPEIVPEDFALFLYSALEGGIFASRLQGNRQRLKTVTRHLLLFIESQVRSKRP